MATVQYKVMYRLLHPVTGTPIKNQYPNEYVPYGCILHNKYSTGASNIPARTINAFNYGVGTTKIGDLRDPSIRAELAPILGTTNPDLSRQVELKFIEKRNQSSNHMYDSLFFFDSTRQVWSYVNSANSTTNNIDAFADLFKQVVGEPWFVHSVHGSFNSALESAKKLSGNIGLSNVDLHKVVPLGMQVVVE